MKLLERSGIFTISARHGWGDIALELTHIILLTKPNRLDNPQIILAGRRMNDNMARYAARNIIKKDVKKRGINLSEATVGILGVTFKDNCPDIRNSKIFDLLKELKPGG